jgi:hypothetical protein
VLIGGTMKYHAEESLLFFQVDLCCGIIQKCGILQEVKLKAVSMARGRMVAHWPSDSMVDMCRTGRSQKLFGKRTQKTLSSSLGLPRRSSMGA